MVGRLRALTRATEAPQVRVARVIADSVEPIPVRSEEKQKRVALGEPRLEQLEGPVLVAERGVDYARLDRDGVALPGRAIVVRLNWNENTLGPSPKAIEGANAGLLKANRYALGMLDAVDSDTQLFLVVTPNNPTGTSLSYAELETIADALPKDVLFVIDEAYTNYHPDGWKTGIDLVVCQNSINAGC